MGWCHEFGVTVREGCGHPMTAGESSCECEECGFVCEGRFAGCSTVWERGPRAFVPVWPSQSALPRHPSAPPERPRRAGAALHREAHDMEDGAQEPNGDFERMAEEATWASATRASLPPTGAHLPVVAAEEARGRVFEWLRESFEGLQAELRVLNEAVDRQQQRLSDLTGALASGAGAAAQPPINRDGWQDKLRALPPAGSRPTVSTR